MQCRVPFECRGLPWVCYGDVSATQAANKVDEKQDLYGSEKDCCVSDVPVEREGGGQEMACGAERSARAGDAGELGVMPGLAGEAGQGHGQEGRVPSDKGEPEVEAAEGLGHEAGGLAALGGYQGEPVVRRGEESEDSGHRHDEVEVGDDEEGVVEVLVENG